MFSWYCYLQLFFCNFYLGYGMQPLNWQSMFYWSILNVTADTIVNYSFKYSLKTRKFYLTDPSCSGIDNSRMKAISTNCHKFVPAEQTKQCPWSNCEHFISFVRLNLTEVCCWIFSCALKNCSVCVWLTDWSDNF